MTKPINSSVAKGKPPKTDDLRIKDIKKVIAPCDVINEYPITREAAETTYQARRSVHDILAGKDKRLLVIIGPCSIHDPKAALEYAEKLLELKKELERELLIIMRVYFEKPRTTVGWKGLINDPCLDGSFNINKGLKLARELLLNLNHMGMPAATEFLDLITPQYVSDLIAWGAIGARTTESQSHRELASGLSCPVGFKNGTDGNINIAIDAIVAAKRPHHFLSLTKEGNSAIVSSKGNEDCHIILRGGMEPNYDAQHVAEVLDKLKNNRHKPPQNIMIDVSHANSDKDYRKQIPVAKNVAEQIASGNKHIIGVMIESHLREGRQELIEGQKPDYGQSITDACIGWEDSESMLRELADAIAKRRQINSSNDS